MRKMDQEEFDKLKYSKSPKDCNHLDIVRINMMGSHIDYGCTVCGLSHTNKEVFEKPGLAEYK